MTDGDAATDGGRGANDGTAVLVPGGRDVRATLDVAGGADGDTDADAAVEGDAGTGADSCVVACPPHPQHRGHRGDERLRAVSDVLGERGVDCLRFDYGDWNEGRGELADACNAVGWARDRYDAVGLFGFSFGGCIALNAAAETDPAAVSVLSPARRVAAGLDSVEALDRVACPVQVVYGTRDDTVDWKPTVERARELDHEVVEFAADHFYIGRAGKVGEAVGSWLAGRL
ncbi:dienelactone hydrolase family protein [Halorarum halophilum]|uniref:Dienelactone hydrolase family protein n=1 Tax=Halorarum halophilum TaxID=2743090 RepID=A0A7D5GC30_9EURY|nr:dienelactone hydrolase family protein [Halobaculum halophilum]QLG27885.1 dienelactone hydrolase family protein [Halobaculum halophilum]